MCQIPWLVLLLVLMLKVAAPSPDGSAAPAPPEGDESRVPDRVKKLRDEAMSVQHRLFHFFTNPVYDICNQAKLLSKRVHRKPRDPESDPDPLDASEFGEVIAVDHTHVFRYRASKTYC